MSILPEFCNDDSAHRSFAATSHATYWQQATLRAAENLALVLHAGDRLTKALNLVLANAVTINADGTTQVRSDQRTYSIPPAEGCPCEDAKRRTRFCEHYIAMLIAKRATALLQDTKHASEQERSQEGTAPSASVSTPWQIHEAPVAYTLTFVCKGVDVHLTMRDVSAAALFARIKRILPKIQEKTQASPEGW